MHRLKLGDIGELIASLKSDAMFEHICLLFTESYFIHSKELHKCTSHTHILCWLCHFIFGELCL